MPVSLTNTICIPSEAQSQIKKMLATNVIQPSSSPWDSPVVLVKKKMVNFAFV